MASASNVSQLQQVAGNSQWKQFTDTTAIHDAGNGHPMLVTIRGIHFNIITDVLHAVSDGPVAKQTQLLSEMPLTIPPSYDS